MTFTKSGGAAIAGHANLGETLIMTIQPSSTSQLTGWRLVPYTCKAFGKEHSTTPFLDLFKAGQNCPETEVQDLISPFKWKPSSNKLSLVSKVKVFEFKGATDILNTLVIECEIILCSQNDIQHGCQAKDYYKNTPSCPSALPNNRRRREAGLVKDDRRPTHTVRGVLRVHSNINGNEQTAGTATKGISLTLVCLLQLGVMLFVRKA
ncbi:uncharacterized protein LOC121385719 [Gigantopelta aegis]|uniref:uncharacterized protein LOC121385719 n=1 Tax=Gigantopelta aegis TaxID=1735272 RepID=UPI001B88DD91|nr:uncharacterized protein LOC121385719 [Gigantopelta aegis]